MGWICVTATVLVFPDPEMSMKILMAFQKLHMTISAFTVYNLSEQSLPYHIHDHHFPAIITTVFQHHTVNSGSFISMHQFPAVIKRVGTSNFRTNLLSAFHGVHSRRNMIGPS